GIDCWLAFSLLLPVHQARDAPVSVGRALVHEPTDQHQQRLVCGLAIGPMRLSGASNPLDQVRTGDRKRGSHGLHCEPSLRPFHDGSGNIGFFTRATSSASLRISTSMVLRPSKRSSSRTRRSSSRTWLVPTTSSSASTARRPPSTVILSLGA